MEVKRIVEVTEEVQRDTEEFHTKMKGIIDEFNDKFNRDIEVSRTFSNCKFPIAQESAENQILRYITEKINSGSMKLVVEPANYDFLSTPLVDDTFKVKKMSVNQGCPDVLELEGLNTKVIAKLSFNGGVENGVQD